MKIACGTDIIEINRIQDAREKSGLRFLKEIYTDGEIEYCQNKKNTKYEHYAARFAAKEAVFKAVYVLLENKFELNWKQAEIKNDKFGKPYIIFHDVEFENRIHSIDISISHCKQYATAYVTMIYE